MVPRERHLLGSPKARTVWRFAAVAVLAFLIGRMADVGPLRDGASSRVAELEAELDRLREALVREADARARLAAQVAELRGQVDAAYAVQAGEALEMEPTVSRLPAVDRAARAVEAVEPSPQQTVPDAAESSAPPVFDVAALVDAGAAPAEAEALRTQWERLIMERLYLTDAANREGWQATAQYRAELLALTEGFRQELGDEAYDQMLYATGRTNRVVVREVVDGSEASRAGLEPGDVILSYDDNRIFTPHALKRETRGGYASETVSLETLRGDDRIRVWVPRGPLGVFLGSDRRPPSG